MEQSPAELVHAGDVTFAVARDHALERHLGGTPRNPPTAEGRIMVGADKGTQFYGVRIAGIESRPLRLGPQLRASCFRM